MHTMAPYINLIKEILAQGYSVQDRTGTGTISVNSSLLKFKDIGAERNFPLLTHKHTHWKSIVHELLWFINGNCTSIDYLKEHGVTIWDDFADKYGELGPIYGHQWRYWPHFDYGLIDQLADVMGELKENPTTRRALVSAWNVADLPNMALPPCHVMFQLMVRDGKLDCHMYQRSADVFLGLPFNIASYALLTMLVAKTIGLEPGDLAISIGNAHIYKNHIRQCEKLIAIDNEDYGVVPGCPTVKVPVEREYIEEYDYDDICLIDYDYVMKIKGEISV